MGPGHVSLRASGAAARSWTSERWEIVACSASGSARSRTLARACGRFHRPSSSRLHRGTHTVAPWGAVTLSGGGAASGHQSWTRTAGRRHAAGGHGVHPRPEALTWAGGDGVQRSVRPRLLGASATCSLTWSQSAQRQCLEPCRDSTLESLACGAKRLPRGKAGSQSAQSCAIPHARLWHALHGPCAGAGRPESSQLAHQVEQSRNEESRPRRLQLGPSRVPEIPRLGSCPGAVDSEVPCGPGGRESGTGTPCGRELASSVGTQ